MRSGKKTASKTSSIQAKSDLSGPTSTLDPYPSQNLTMQSCQAGHSIFKEKCRLCRTMRKEWYSYLKQEGFEDIEKGEQLVDEGQRFLLDNKAFQSPQTFHAQVNYYQWARSKVNDGEFKAERDKLIWEYHSEGLSGRQMAPRIGLGQSWLSRKIHKIENYLKDQMNQLGSMSFSQGIA